MKDSFRILVYGFGNPGRQDDGLGVLLSGNIEKWARDNNLESIQTDSNYQLNIEDSSRIASFNLVVFADASLEDIEGYAFTTLEPSLKVDFTMHSVSPAFILNLCHEIYHTHPSAFLLHIKGYEWEFMKDMTGKASQNLKEATTFLENYLLKYIENSAQKTKITSDGNNT